MATLTELGILTGDNSPVNINKFVTAVLNNKLSSEAIQAFILATQGGMEMISQSLALNISINNSLNEKSMAQIEQVMKANQGKELTANLLIQQLIQINSIIELQKHTQKMNFFTIALKVAGVIIGLLLIFWLVKLIINWIGTILLIVVIGGLLLLGFARD